MNDRCKEMVRSPSLSFYRPTQCSRSIWKDGYCRQHHPEAVEAREARSKAAFQKKLENSPYRKIARLSEELADAKARITELLALLDKQPAPSLGERCEDYYGTGRRFVGFSGQDSDGNTPEFEPCDNCEPPQERGKQS